MTAILTFFVAHWILSIFAQTFFLHRYGAHRMFTMSRGWERFFYIFSLVAQGPSFLIPRAYAFLHREHHAFADSERDPHSPLYHKNVAGMMWHTKGQYDAYAYRRAEPETRFRGGVPEWRGVGGVVPRRAGGRGGGGLFGGVFRAVCAPAGGVLPLPGALGVGSGFRAGLHRGRPQ